MATLCLRFCDHCPDLDRQTLLAGAICHDLGKYGNSPAASPTTTPTPGGWSGTSICASESLTAISPIRAQRGADPPFPASYPEPPRVVRVRFAAPAATAEAFALHYADNIDAKITQSRSLFGELEDGESGWSPTRNRWAPIVPGPKPRKPNRASPTLQKRTAAEPEALVEPVFITLEGIEGSGKTTLIENLADVFRT